MSHDDHGTTGRTYHPDHPPTTTRTERPAPADEVGERRHQRPLTREEIEELYGPGDESAPYGAAGVDRPVHRAAVRPSPSRPDLTAGQLLEGPLEAITDLGRRPPVSPDLGPRILAIAKALTQNSRVDPLHAAETLRILLDDLEAAEHRRSGS